MQIIRKRESDNEETEERDESSSRPLNQLEMSQSIKPLILQESFESISNSDSDDNTAQFKSGSGQGSGGSTENLKESNSPDGITNQNQDQLSLFNLPQFIQTLSNQDLTTRYLASQNSLSCRNMPINAQFKFRVIPIKKDNFIAPKRYSQIYPASYLNPFFISTPTSNQKQQFHKSGNQNRQDDIEELKFETSSNQSQQNRNLSQRNNDSLQQDEDSSRNLIAFTNQEQPIINYYKREPRKKLSQLTQQNRNVIMIQTKQVSYPEADINEQADSQKTSTLINLRQTATNFSQSVQQNLSTYKRQVKNLLKTPQVNKSNLTDKNQLYRI
ncbi:UNKNOWN [Stylonychia lemnae]|uniref:Uncharacterized protein n=1 Tax=Stylonychia lemnae TaxID=5949 RepID=A0A078AG46_STYLE|nr:UNKNOWN [Stylonychia lemnae]|eukprot:CDW80437.1 UNKNOWN [Stylonychia lemnae]